MGRECRECVHYGKMVNQCCAPIPLWAVNEERDVGNSFRSPYTNAVKCDAFDPLGKKIMNESSCEMTLDEWCARLPDDHRVNKDLAKLKAKRDAEIDEFNAGYKAAQEGKPESSEPHDTQCDVWLIGYAWCKYPDLKAEIGNVKKLLQERCLSCGGSMASGGTLANIIRQIKPRLEQIIDDEGETCGRCEGNGAMWADGKAHYMSENCPTVLCGNCGGSGRIMGEDAKDIARAALKIIGETK